MFQVFDLHNEATSRVGLNIQAIATSTNTDGPIIDTAHFESLEFYIQSCTLTDGTYTAQLFHGNDSGLSDGVQLTTEELLGSAVFILTDDNATRRIGYVGKKRYVRLRIVSTGVTTGGTLGAIAVLGTPQHAPAAASV
jgi:hypothetical protein